jgi:hypothetical protein
VTFGDWGMGRSPDRIDELGRVPAQGKTEVKPNRCGALFSRKSSIYKEKWRAQGDDLRTFLNEFVSGLPQVEIPVGLSLPVRAILLPQREFFR